MRIKTAILRIIYLILVSLLLNCQNDGLLLYRFYADGGSILNFTATVRPEFSLTRQETDNFGNILEIKNVLKRRYFNLTYSDGSIGYFSKDDIFNVDGKEFIQDFREPRQYRLTDLHYQIIQNVEYFSVGDYLNDVDIPPDVDLFPLPSDKSLLFHTYLPYPYLEGYHEINRFVFNNIKFSNESNTNVEITVELSISDVGVTRIIKQKDFEDTVTIKTSYNILVKNNAQPTPLIILSRKREIIESYSPKVGLIYQFDKWINTDGSLLKSYTYELKNPEQLNNY